MLDIRLMVVEGITADNQGNAFHEAAEFCDAAGYEIQRYGGCDLEKGEVTLVVSVPEKTTIRVKATKNEEEK